MNKLRYVGESIVLDLFVVMNFLQNLLNEHPPLSYDSF